MSAPAKALTIAHVDPELGYSGGEVQVFLLIDGLAAAGHRNVLFCQAGSRAQAVAAERGIETITAPMRNDADLVGVLALRRGLCAVGADIVHLHTGRASWLGGLAARWARLPALVTRRMDRRIRRGLRTRLIYRHLSRATAAISPSVRQGLLDGGVPAERVRVIWDSVDPAALTPRRGRSEVRSELGAADAPAILFLGALVRRKGVDVLLEAAARLDQGTAWELWIAGDGAQREELEQRSSALGLSPRVRFLGPRTDVPDLLGAADLLVLPSRAEGLGVAALEAMAAGLAVVASRVGGLGEVVVAGETGLSIPPGDPAALAEALGRLLHDATLRQRLGAGGRRRVSERFTAALMVADYLDLYREILAVRT